MHWDLFVAGILQTKCCNLVKEAKILKYGHLGKTLLNSASAYERKQKWGKFVSLKIEAF